MLTLGQHLTLNACPHCFVDFPNLELKEKITGKFEEADEEKTTGIYICKRCNGVVTAVVYHPQTEVRFIYPTVETANVNIPERAREYLNQAINCLQRSPVGTVILCASAVDAMLKEKEKLNQADNSEIVKSKRVHMTLNNRINEAISGGILTKEMSDWAHQVRLDANDQRHADDNASLPTFLEAKSAVEFTKMLGEILFVLPSRVKRGMFSIPAEQNTTKSNITIKPKNIKIKAYRNSSYEQNLTLRNNDVKPMVTASIYYSRGGRLLPSDLQPAELIVENRQGNPKWWFAKLVINDCNKFPMVSFIEIKVNDQVEFAGDITVGYETTI